MSDHEHDALNALRDLDGPADLGDGIAARIEAEVLARFDDSVDSGATDDERRIVIALEDERDQIVRRRSKPLAMAVTAAAAIAVIVAGTVAILSRDVPAPGRPPSDQGTTTAVSTRPDESAVADQLSAFCEAYIVPLRVADETWRPVGETSEARSDVLIAIEQAAGAMNDLSGPLGERLSNLAEQALEAATEARLAHTLESADADDTVGGARDLVLQALPMSELQQLPSNCLP